MPGLTTVPAATLVSGTARIAAGKEVIRVSDRARVPVTQLAIRDAVGPFRATDLALDGYFVSIGGATCWVRESDADFTGDTLPTAGNVTITLDGQKYIGNITAV